MVCTYMSHRPKQNKYFIFSLRLMSVDMFRVGSLYVFIFFSIPEYASRDKKDLAAVAACEVENEMKLLNYSLNDLSK